MITNRCIKIVILNMMLKKGKREKKEEKELKTFQIYWTSI